MAMVFFNRVFTSKEVFLNHEIHISRNSSTSFQICLEQLKFRRTLNALGVRELSVSRILSRPHGLYDILDKNGEDTVQIQLGDQFIRKDGPFCIRSSWSRS